ncbi:hypothetical protein [Actinacidiphila sp. bgisy160]|uniref:hypothetical protein n=1 Tax=Actinacidiphila sp. bgisy160 TaxID=3413796 RepID=UPI003D73B67E
MLVTLIIGCEIAFWVLLGAGLAVRYLLRRPRAGAALLVCVPLVDVVLLAVAAADLREGGTAGARHALAAVYVGFSAGYGHSVVRRADARFAHRFSGGPKPPPAPRYGRARAVHEWRLLGRTAVSAAVAAALLRLAVRLVADAGRTAALREWQVRMVATAGIHAVVAASYTLWPKREPAARPRE